MLQHRFKHAQACSKVTPGADGAHDLRMVRTTYGEHEQIMRDHRCRCWGLVTGRILNSKICRWLG
jgi:hypothetical protein